MLYLCEVTAIDDPDTLRRIKAYVISDGGLGETEWMFCAAPEGQTPAVGDLVWASIVNAERNVYVWHHLVPPAERDATADLYGEALDNYS